MQMFMFISGYFSKRQMKFSAIFKNYFLPYIVFDIAYAVYSIIRGTGDINSLNLFTPTYVYWYILCLGFMRLLGSSKIKNRYIFVAAVVLTFITPLLIDKEHWLILSWGRVGLLWFMFYAGLRTSYRHLEKLRNNKLICIGILVLCVVAEFLLLKSNVIDISWATHNYPLSFKESILKYILMIFTIGCFCGCAALAPENAGLLSRWGRNSLVVYLLHPYMVDVLKVILVKLNVDWNAGLYFSLLLVAAITTDLLSRDIIKGAYNKTINMICRALRIA